MTQPEPSTVEELRAEQQKEYGTYIAAEPIDIDGARAFNTGDSVPVSHVERGLVRSDQIAKRATKLGAEIEKSVGVVPTKG